MSLDEYVSVGNRDTFCQWLETKTRDLGSIKGINSSKFGIYKRRNPEKRPKNLTNDKTHSWQSYYGPTKRKAFENVKNEILQIITYATNGDFDKIDDLHLTVFVKWKIAYLYSNERLIPIFKKSVLEKIAKHFGLEIHRRTTYSEIQEIIINNKPSHVSIYQYAEDLYDKFGRDKGKTTNTGRRRRTTRKSATGRNTNSQNRSKTSNYVANQKHNLIQESLQLRLENEYGKENVFLEENYVDIKVKLQDKVLFYEVKSSSYASDCVREGLGQILSYYQKDKDKREKKLFIVGQYAPNKDELEYIEFIKKKLKIPFEYMAVEIKE